MSKIKDLIGKKFGKLTVLERDLNKKGNGAYWICQCDCGTIKTIRGSNLTASNNPTRSCGCLAKEKAKQKIDTTSLLNKTFCRLTVIERDMTKPIGHGRDSYWICQCICGTQISVRYSDLISGHTQSCGCLKKEQLRERNTIDISNQKFGHLIALERTSEQTSKKDWLWKCQCDCGNIVLIATNNLTSGKTQSCGCKNISRGEEKINNILIENNINFAKEYSFSNLRSDKGKLLRYDFVILNDENQPVRIIEFDGEQHFRKTSPFYSEVLIQNDQKKNNYAKSNNIPIVRIPYTEIDNLSLELLLGDRFLL